MTEEKNPSPDTGGGFTRIANELMDALINFRIPGEERQCLDFIIRKTYGYNKKEDAISNSQFVAATGLKKGNVCRSLKNLVTKNLVIKSDNKAIIIYRFNKYYKTWKQLSKKITVIKSDTKVIKSDNKSLSKVRDTKDNKDNIQKTIFSSDSPEVRLSELLFSLILQNNPKSKKPNIQSWAKHVDLAHRRDNRSLEDLEKVIRWSQQDSFWLQNILSTGKLREKYDQLFLKMTKSNGKSKPPKKEENFDPGKYTGTDTSKLDWCND
jgi:phage replication O-like protein O